MELEVGPLKPTPISAHPREERAWTGARLGCLGMTLVKAFGILIEARGEGEDRRNPTPAGQKRPDLGAPVIAGIAEIARHRRDRKN
jgi:hypothetical protein